MLHKLDVIYCTVLATIGAVLMITESQVHKTMFFKNLHMHPVDALMHDNSIATHSYSGSYIPW